MEIVNQIGIPTRCPKAASGFCQIINKEIVHVRFHKDGKVLYSSACFEESERRICSGAYVYSEKKFYETHPEAKGL